MVAGFCPPFSDTRFCWVVTVTVYFTPWRCRSRRRLSRTFFEVYLYRRLDRIEWAVGSDCIGGWTVLYNVSAVGSYQSDRPFIHIVSAVGSYRNGGWAMLYRRLDHTVSADGNCIGGWIILYRRLDYDISTVG